MNSINLNLFVCPASRYTKITDSLDALALSFVERDSSDTSKGMCLPYADCINSSSGFLGFLAKFYQNYILLGLEKIQ